MHADVSNCMHAQLKREQCQDGLNKMCHIDPLQGKHTEAKVSSFNVVFEQQIEDQLKCYI